jgi:maleate isomerase
MGPERILLGMLTPSSNTILEPVTCAMLADVSGVSAHFARFRVTEISLGDRALSQFDDVPILEAARLLADAHVGCITWNGTSAGWLGLARDSDLCAAITRETGVPATSSVLALAEILRKTGVARYGLVTPYVDEIQAKIVENFAGEGFACAGERHVGDKGNFSFSEVSAATIADMVRAVAKEKPQAITIFCTNLAGAPLVEALERETGIPIYDTVATALWGSLRLAGGDPAAVRGWGRLFREVR